MKVLVQNLQKKSGLGTRELRGQYDPDVLLAQEINLRTEDRALFPAINVSSVGGFGTAIGLGVRQNGATCTDVRQVSSPYAELGGFIRKKTTVATVALVVRKNTGDICSNSHRDGQLISNRGEEDDCDNAGDNDNDNDNVNDNGNDIGTVQLVSFHGYNGQPLQNISKLVAHVDAVLAVLPPPTTNNGDGGSDPPIPVLFAGDFNTWTQAHLDAVESRLGAAGFRRACSWPYPGRECALDHVFVRGMELEGAEFYRNESDHGGAFLELRML